MYFMFFFGVFLSYNFKVLETCLSCCYCGLKVFYVIIDLFFSKSRVILLSYAAQRRRRRKWLKSRSTGICHQDITVFLSLGEKIMRSRKRHIFNAHNCELGSNLWPKTKLFRGHKNHSCLLMSKETASIHMRVGKGNDIYTIYTF